MGSRAPQQVGLSQAQTARWVQERAKSTQEKAWEAVTHPQRVQVWKQTRVVVERVGEVEMVKVGW